MSCILYQEWSPLLQGIFVQLLFNSSKWPFSENNHEPPKEKKTQKTLSETVSLFYKTNVLKELTYCYKSASYGSYCKINLISFHSK